jgi:hypothetical protein
MARPLLRELDSTKERDKKERENDIFHIVLYNEIPVYKIDIKLRLMYRYHPRASLLSLSMPVLRLRHLSLKA